MAILTSVCTVFQESNMYLDERRVAVFLKDLMSQECKSHFSLITPNTKNCCVTAELGLF